MANFGVQLTFLLNANSKEDVAEQIVTLLSAGEVAGVTVGEAVVRIDALPAEMGGTGNAPDNKIQMTKVEQERRDMIRRSCDRRMN